MRTPSSTGGGRGDAGAEDSAEQDFFFPATHDGLLLEDFDLLDGGGLHERRWTVRV